MLTSSLAEGYGRHTQRKLLPRDRTATNLVDKSFSLAAQSMSLANNIALLLVAIPRLSTAARGVSEEDLYFIAKCSPGDGRAAGQIRAATAGQAPSPTRGSGKKDVWRLGRRVPAPNASAMGTARRFSRTNVVQMS